MPACKKCSLENASEDLYAKSAKCKLCAQWTNLQNNAKKESRDLSITLDEFKRLYGRSAARTCFYCGIGEAGLLKLGIKNPRGHATEALGLDRRDSSKGYGLDNVVMCCLVCNRIKSNMFSVAEMQEIGKRLNATWVARNLLPAPAQVTRKP